MIKLLSMETCRSMRRTMINILYDSKACFDKIRREQSNLLLLKKNVCPELAKARAMIKDRMSKRVKTRLGVSEATYQHKKGSQTSTARSKEPGMFLLSSYCRVTLR